MRHGRTHNHLGRTNAHRSAMLSNMACSLIQYKRIETTVAKARELRRYVEPILTKAKTDDTHSRRIIFSYLQDKEALKELFGVVSEKIANRPGGYTRIIKLGNRLGDNADMALIELVDFNELMLTEAKPAKAKTRRSRRAGGAAAPAVAAVANEVAVEEAPMVEDLLDTVAVTETTTEEVVAEASVAEVTSEVEEVAVVDEAPEVSSDETPSAPEATAEGEEEKA